MLRIVNGRVYDPLNNIDGQLRDICIADGRIVADVPAGTPVIDARGMVVMPGGVDMHAHIAGPKVNLARKLIPENRRLDPHMRTKFTRSGSGGTVPSTFATGYRYALLGYTTVMEAAAPPLAARHVIEELYDTPIIDKGFFTLLGNNVLLFKLIQEKRFDVLRNAVGWWLNAAKAFTPKLVNPGGVEMWKRGNKNVTDQNTVIEGFDITPMQVIEALAIAVDELGLPHPIHLHCNNLGHAGNITTTLETMRGLDGHRAHMTHIQFHSYGGAIGGKPVSRAAEIIAMLDKSPLLSADVGQVMFGDAVTMTADAPLSYMLHKLNHGKWINADVENETGCGIVPYQYKDSNYTHALQWGIGLELFLLNNDPWRMVLSTDHPNGGSFMSYPRLIRLLMDRSFRNEEIRKVNQDAMQATVLLDDIAREYTLQEIAIITRAAPAKLLGLKNKGHLGLGADADITIYEEKADKEAMFSTPRYVVKSGKVIIEDGEFRMDHRGKLLHVAPHYDPSIMETLKPFFDDYYSIQLENYPVSDAYLHDHEVIG